MNIAIFASGSGSNAENIIQYFSDRKDVKIPVILSNSKDAYVHERAKKLGVTSICFTKKALNESEQVLCLLKQYDIDFVVLAGFLLKIPDYLVKAYPNRIINIHPSLLPKYGGKGMFGQHVHEAVINSGDKESGITIHYVNEFYDEGQTIFQITCPVTPKDNADSLAEKIHALEYKHYPAIIEKLIDVSPE